MTPERYRQVKQVFAEACVRTPAERGAFLATACAQDPELRAEVESLLAHDDCALPLGPGISAAEVLEWVRLSPEDQPAGATEAAWAAAHAPLPDWIGRYRIIRKLGEGGMGAVYEAEQDNPRRTVALKVIRSGLASDQVLRRFRLEALVLGRLQHPGIAQIYEAGTAELRAADGAVFEQPFFVMELIRGQPLDAFMRQQRPPLRTRLELLAKVCDAVAHAHLHGVIHRDLKPGNILVDEAAQPHVLDFGVARVVAPDAPLTTLHTDAGQLIGTLAYMSPEQLAGNTRALDIRSDVYALGVLTFQVLADRLPYDLAGRTLPEAARTITDQEPTPLSALSRAFRGDLSTIVAKALEKDRQRRYPSAAALAEDIRRYLSNQPISARPATTLYHLGKFARRNPAFVAAVAAAFVLLVVGIVGTTSQAVRATRARNRALEAEHLAELRRDDAEAHRAEADAQRIEAQRQAAIAQAVNDFLTEDLLAAASPDREPDRGITVREVLDRAANAIGDRFQAQPLVEASVRMALGQAYYALGEYALAESQLTRAAALREAQSGADDPDALTSLHVLAGLRSNQARYAEAEALLDRVLAARRRILGPEDRATLATMNLLALLYGRQGRDADEERLLLQTIDLAQRCIGPEDRATLIAQANLADVYSRQRRYAEAEALYQQVLAAERRTVGDEHTSTLSSMSNLANVYARQGRYAEAEPLCLQTLETRRRVLGPDHPATLASLNSLAVLYRQQGRAAEAEPLLVQALDAKRGALGPEHPSTLVSMHNLANLYAEQARFAEAEALYLQTLELRRRVLGPRHPQTLSTIGNLAELCTAQDRPAEAAAWRAQLPHPEAASQRGPQSAPAAQPAGAARP